MPPTVLQSGVDLENELHNKTYCVTGGVYVHLDKISSQVFPTFQLLSY